MPKPTVQRPWADTGTKIAPSDGRRNTGYIHNDAPTWQELNALLNELTTLERYVMKVGISTWDAAETYGVGDIVRDTVDGELYVCDIAAPVVGTRPGSAAAHWAPYYRRIRSIAGNLGQELVAWRNARSIRRFGVSHQGFPGGQIYQWDENWDLPLGIQFDSTNTGLAKWTSFLNGGTLATFPPGNTGLLSPMFRTAVITPPTGSTSATFVRKSVSFEFFMSADTAIEIECAIAMSEIGANRTTLSFGLANAFAGASRGIVVGKAATDTSWQFSSAETGSIDTTVPPSANVFQILKIELLGANQSDSGISTANLFINGSPIANSDLAVSNGALLFPVFGGVTTTTGGAAVPIAFGPIKLRSSSRAGDFF